MSAANKFTFDVEFRADGEVLSNAARVRRKTSMTQDELDQLCAKYRAEGIKFGQVRALESVAAGAREAAEAVRDAVDRVMTELEAVRAESAELALVAARKLARFALAAAPTSEVEAALRDAMHQAIGEPRIVLRASPQIAESISAQLETIARDEGFEGRVQIASDAGFKDADCRIEWRGGGAERSEAAIETALADIVARRFSGRVQQLTEEDANVGE